MFHKCLEVGLQTNCLEGTGLDFYWRFRTREDHAGLKIFFSVGRWLFEFNVYDDRHWDSDKDCWES